MSPELKDLLERSRKLVDAMAPEEKAEMLEAQAQSWARTELQWAKDFREGKCERD